MANRELVGAISTNDDADLLVVAPHDEHSDEDQPEWNCPTRIYATIGPAIFGYSRELRDIYDDFSPQLSHVHGIWMYYSSANLSYARTQSVPYIVSPHGMLDSWAVQNSSWKKKFAGLLYEDRHLRSANCLHALCESEANSMREYGLTNPICVIPNGVNLPPSALSADSVPATAVGRKKQLLFLGRIHPKKGLSQMMKAFAAIPKEERRHWNVKIAGWDQGHQTDLQNLAKQLGISTDVLFVGAKFGKEKEKLLKSCDAFILPSFSEGLPMSVLEAWSYRKSSIITTACNLPEGAANDAAIECTPEVPSLQRAMIQLFSAEQDTRAQMGQKAYRLLEQKFTWPIIAQQMCSVYKWLLGQRTMPSTVRLD